MKLSTLTYMALGVVLAAMAAAVVGCSPEYPIKWRATEAQKQAADLVVTDVAALKPHVAPEAEPIRAEAEQAAKVTQTYVGLPETRPTPVAVGNTETLDQARQDATKPPPTIGETATAVIDEGKRGADAAFGIVDGVLGLLAAAGGTYGLTTLTRRVRGWQQAKANLEVEVDNQYQALKELVTGIDKLTPEAKAQVKTIMKTVQSPLTAEMVATAKAASKSQE